MNRAYVSDFEIFMNQFLKEHPEVVEARMRGYRSFWEVKIEPANANVSKENIVRDEHYGFF